MGKTGSETWTFNKDQIYEVGRHIQSVFDEADHALLPLQALKDPRVYLFFLMMVCTGLPNGGVGAFGPTIIAGCTFSH